MAQDANAPKSPARQVRERTMSAGFVQCCITLAAERIHRAVTIPQTCSAQPLGCHPRRTLYVHSSWNEFYYVPLKPSVPIRLSLKIFLEPECTAADTGPLFLSRSRPRQQFFSSTSLVYTGFLIAVNAIALSTCADASTSARHRAVVTDAVSTSRSTSHRMPWCKDALFCDFVRARSLFLTGCRVCVHDFPARRRIYSLRPGSVLPKDISTSPSNIACIEPVATASTSFRSDRRYQPSPLRPYFFTLSASMLNV